jgi:hypothetical protein
MASINFSHLLPDEETEEQEEILEDQDEVVEGVGSVEKTNDEEELSADDDLTIQVSIIKDSGI